MSTSAVEASRHEDLPPLTDGPWRRRFNIVVIAATFGGILFGYDTGVVNGALDPMKRDLGLTAVTSGLVTSVLQMGAAVGAVTVGMLVDRLGRRRVLLYLAWVFMIGTLICVLAPHLPVLLIGRIILGLAVGGASVICPVYLSEMAPTEWRGRTSARNDVMVCLGQLLAFVCNALIHLAFGQHDSVWRYMLAVAMIPALLLFLFMLRTPESPRWLVAHGHIDKAEASLEHVRPVARAQAELQSIIEIAEANAHKATMGLGAILRTRWVRNLLLVGILIAIVQQLTGINAIMFYGTQLLENLGFAADTAIVVNIANGIVSVAGMFVGMAVISRFRRRQMLLFGLGTIVVVHLLIALLSRVMAETRTKAIVIMLLVLVFVFVMQACLGLVVWVVLGEMFPLKARGAAMGTATFFNWIGNSAVGFLFPSLLAKFGTQGTFLIFGVVNVVTFILVWRLLPETGTLSLEELEERFEKEGVMSVR
jgi:sugar porter (SP) family MFS transporter